jgi:hypothetical protein avisC_05662
MIDPATAEVLFMGTEAETSGLEAFNAIKDEESLDNDTAAVRTISILTQLLNSRMIEIWLGDPKSRDPIYRPNDPVGATIITKQRILTMDEPDGRMLVYITTDVGENLLKNS